MRKDYKLTLLENFKLILPENFEFPSYELRYLYWERYSLKSLPSNFKGENLVKIKLPNSNIRQLWQGNKVGLRLVCYYCFTLYYFIESYLLKQFYFLSFTMSWKVKGLRFIGFQAAH